jgi:uncharacterized protein YndB with AHSA1/START domain
MTASDEAKHLAPLKTSRLLHARSETAFMAWGSADSVKRWFAPAPYTVPEAKIEMRVGGAFDVCMRSPSGEEHWTRGTFLEVTPHTRLAIEMRPTASDGDVVFHALTELSFVEVPGGTRIDVVQTYTLLDAARAAPMVAGAPIGWQMTLNQFAREVVRLQGGTDVGTRSSVHDTFRIERVYQTPIARVWTALTDESAKAKWFGGPSGRFEVVERRMDVRPGGSERLQGRWEGGIVSTFDAIYHDVVPQSRLIYSYEMHLDDKKISVSLATMELTAEGTGTRLVVTEQGVFLDGYKDAGSREQGTGHLLDSLGVSLGV